MNASPPRRRLFITNEAMGDTVMSSGLFRALNTNGWQLDLLGKPYLDLFTHSDIANDCFLDPHAGVYSWRRRFNKNDKLLRHKLSAIGYQDIVVFSRDMKRGLHRWLKSWYKGTISVIPPINVNVGAHNISRYEAAAKSLGVESAFIPTPRLSVNAQKAFHFSGKITSLVGVLPIALQSGNSVTHDPRRWYRWRPRPQPNLKALPTKTWVSIITELLRKNIASGILFQGSNQERVLADKIIQQLPLDIRQRVHTWTMGLSAPDMAAVLTCCKVLISVDTGPAHVAAALGVPVVVAFGPTPYQQYHPSGANAVSVVIGKAPCSPCHGTPKARQCRANICLSQLDWKKIVSATRTLLDKPMPGVLVVE